MTMSVTCRVVLNFLESDDVEALESVVSKAYAGGCYHPCKVLSCGEGIDGEGILYAEVCVILPNGAREWIRESGSFSLHGNRSERCAVAQVKEVGVVKSI